MSSGTETVVAPVTEHVAAVEDHAAAVVEHAAEQVEAAQATAAHIAEAAMHTAVGETVAEVAEELDTWQQRTVAVEQENAHLRGMVEAMQVQLSSLTAPTTLIPPPSEPEPEPPVEVAPEVMPEPVTTVVESVAPEVRARKRRWL